MTRNLLVGYLQAFLVTQELILFAHQQITKHWSLQQLFWYAVKCILYTKYVVVGKGYHANIVDVFIFKYWKSIWRGRGTGRAIVSRTVYQSVAPLYRGLMYCFAFCINTNTMNCRWEVIDKAKLSLSEEQVSSLCSITSTGPLFQCGEPLRLNNPGLQS